jgi:hypothetical protein
MGGLGGLGGLNIPTTSTQSKNINNSRYNWSKRVIQITTWNISKYGFYKWICKYWRIEANRRKCIDGNLKIIGYVLMNW